MATNRRTQKQILRRLLRDVREQANIRQIDLAERLNRPQSFVSKYESGEKTLSLIEVREICDALGVSLSKFISLFEEEIHAG